MAKAKEAALGGPEPLDLDLLEPALSTVANERMSGIRERAHLRRLNRNGAMRRLATARAARKFEEEGGDVGDIQSFMEWLIQNWESILKMITSIIALFAV